MVAVLENHRDAFATLCARYGVIRKDAVGSALSDNFGSGERDVDLLASSSHQGTAPDDAHFDLFGELPALLGIDFG